MKNIFVIAIFLILLPALSFADTIILKRGRPIRVEKAWEQDGHIYFYLHGLKMRVSKKSKTYISKDGKLVRIKKKKDLYKVFTKQQKKMKYYIKKNKLSHKDEGHLVLMALYYQEKL